MKKIILQIDKPKWAIDNNCREVESALEGKFDFERQYTKHNDRKVKGDYDLVFCGMFSVPRNVPREKLAGHMFGLHERNLGEYLKRFEKVKAIGVGAPYMVRMLHGKLDIPMRYLPVMINTDKFIPANKYDCEVLTVGWVGQTVKKSGFSDKNHDIIADVVSGTECVQIHSHVYSDSRGGYDDMVKYYHNIDAYVCFSDEEGFGMPIAEAASCGVPVITRNVGCAEEMSGAVMYVETPEDLKKAIIKLRDNPDLRKELGAKGREAVINNFGYKKLAPVYEDFFNENL